MALTPMGNLYFLEEIKSLLSSLTECDLIIGSKLPDIDKSTGTVLASDFLVQSLGQDSNEFFFLFLVKLPVLTKSSSMFFFEARLEHPKHAMMKLYRPGYKVCDWPACVLNLVWVKERVELGAELFLKLI